jgi:DNA-binding IclR family transcriptional regulator
MEKKTPTTYFVPALAKALDVIEYLSHKTEPLPLSVIAKDLGRTSSELFRIMDYLVQRNYVIKEENLNSYTLSLKFFELTFNIPLVRRIVEAASPFLNKLSAEIGYSSHLSLVEGGNLVILYEEESIWPVYIHVKVGARIPATATSSGRLLLGLMSETDRENSLTLDTSFMARSQIEKDRIRDEIRSSGRQKVFTSRSKQHEGVIDVVSAIELYKGKYAALAVPMSGSAEKTPAHVKTAVSAAAASIQQRLTGVHSG